MTVSDMTLPHGTASAGSDRAQVRARARARIAATVRSGKKIRVAAPVTRIATATYRDITGSWVVKQSPPTLAQIATADVAATVPGQHHLLAGFATGWKYAVAIPSTALLYTLAWLLQHPARGLTAITIAGGTTVLLLWN